MSTNLTGNTIASTYAQLLHVDGGPSATEKVVHSGAGVATALKVGTVSVSAGGVQLADNMVSAVSGDLIIGPNVAFSDASNARAALGLGVYGSMASQNADAVSITGGTISDVTVDNITGGTLSGVTVTGGTFSGATVSSGSINNASIGSSSPAAITGTDVWATTSLGYPDSAGRFGLQPGSSKTENMVLNAPCGRIQMNSGTIAANTALSFMLSNSFIDSTDVVVASIASALLGVYLLTVDNVGVGFCKFTLRNLTINDYGESITFNFAVIKAGYV